MQTTSLRVFFGACLIALASSAARAEPTVAALAPEALAAPVAPDAR